MLKHFIRKNNTKGDQAKNVVRIDHGEIRPSKQLQDAIAAIIRGNPEFA